MVDIKGDLIGNAVSLLEKAALVVKRSRQMEDELSFDGEVSLEEKVIVAQLMIALQHYDDHVLEHGEREKSAAQARGRLKEVQLQIIQGLPMQPRPVPPEEMPTADQAVLDVTIYRTAFGWVVKEANEAQENISGAKTPEELVHAFGRIATRVLREQSSGPSEAKP
jgi:hypothetical protein